MRCLPPLAVLASMLVMPALAQQPTALDLLKSADRARGGVGQGITWNVTVEATEEGDTTSRAFLVKARGDDALVESLAPPRYKGEIMLFNDRQGIPLGHEQFGWRRPAASRFVFW